MADFVQTMKQWRRMCSTCHTNERGSCGCYPAGTFAICYMKTIAKEAECACDDRKLERYFDRIEKAIMAWAAEHPEPQYPTWLEWLHKQLPELHGQDDHGAILTLLSNRIPAEIAQKLGVEPKEDA